MVIFGSLERGKFNQWPSISGSGLDFGLVSASIPGLASWIGNSIDLNSPFWFWLGIDLDKFRSRLRLRISGRLLGFRLNSLGTWLTLEFWKRSFGMGFEMDFRLRLPGLFENEMDASLGV
ncbi:uncharacterized protein OCT59_012858 [Rhizophagus irregularis]|uniref:uncharacterized protein n=1 Tax=Rhizophagus irregularis TaxID=588596 RepID=UPI003318C561|nr:hypothetical protein OCT59_012858 [Rhizophagus irregularis]